MCARPPPTTASTFLWVFHAMIDLRVLLLLLLLLLDPSNSFDFCRWYTIYFFMLKRCTGHPSFSGVTRCCLMVAFR